MAERLNSTVKTIEDLSSSTGLRDAHSSSDSTSNLSSWLHDHTETSLEASAEVAPEIKVLHGGDSADTLVQSVEDLSSGGDLRLSSGLANNTEDRSSRLHDHAESFLEALSEITPETELLELRWILNLLELLKSMDLSNLSTEVGNLAPAVLGVEIVDGMGSRSPV